MNARPGTLYHVELWVPDLPRAVAECGWLLTRLSHDSLRRRAESPG